MGTANLLGLWDTLKNKGNKFFREGQIYSVDSCIFAQLASTLASDGLMHAAVVKLYLVRIPSKLRAFITTEAAWPPEFVWILMKALPQSFKDLCPVMHMFQNKRKGKWTKYAENPKGPSREQPVKNGEKKHLKWQKMSKVAQSNCLHPKLKIRQKWSGMV